MSNSNCETTLVSQLLDSIDNHLKMIHLPMEQCQMSVDNANNDELSLSGHRSIFSSYGNYSRKIPLSFRDSQYEGFHWDLYEDHNYHHLTFEYDQENPCQTTSLSDWSMHLNSDDTEDDVDDTTSSSSSSLSNPPQTSWHEIKAKSIQNSYSSSTNTSDSDHYSPNPLTLYRLFQHKKSRQHPCHLYQNFSDRSLCDSSSTSYSNSIKEKRKVPIPRIKLKSPITFSQLKSNQSSIEQLSSKSNVDQCLQTSTILSPTDNSIVIHTKNIDRLLNKNPSHPLPDLDFLTYYAKENPIPLSTQTKHFCTAMKNPLFLTKKPTHTVFYCSIPSSNQPILKPRTLKEIKRIKHIKTSPPTLSTEETETFSSTYSSTSSSSGYFSNSSTNQPRHIQTPSSSYPLKSCLKRTKTDDSTTNVLAEDVFTLSAQFLPKKIESSKFRRYSTPTEQKLSLQLRTENKTCTFSEHDLRAKKSVSFCDEIARRLITPSINSKHQYQDYCDLVPRESLTDSPPNEFHFSNETEDELINFTETIPDDLTKPLPIKYGNDKYLIDAFANIILHILEIKCHDSKSYYLNNQTNQELDRILRQDLCLLLREILEDGLRQYSNSLFSKKINLWRLIDLTTPTIGRFHEAKIKAQNGFSSNVDWIEKFNSFIYHLLNLHELASWLTHFLSHQTLFKTYYESWAFVLVNKNNNLFENLTNQLEKLSPLQFRLKYQMLPLINPRLSSSILPKKFHMRNWLRDRKSQVKIPAISSVPPNISIRRKFNSVPVVKRH